jgi:hypothetical protein
MFAIRGERPDHAAANVLHVLTREDDSGTYYDERRPSTPNPQAFDPAAQRSVHEYVRAALAPLLS